MAEYEKVRGKGTTWSILLLFSGVFPRELV